MGLGERKRPLPEPAPLFVTRQVHEHQPVVSRLQLPDIVRGRIRIKLPVEQQVIDDDVGMKIVGQFHDAAMEVEIESIAEAQLRVRRILVDQLQHPAALIERARKVLTDKYRLRKDAS